MAFAVVEGSIFRKEHRSGIARATQQPYQMDILHILVPGAGITELVLPQELPAAFYGEGQEVSFLVEIRRSERGFNLNVLQDKNLGSHAAEKASV